MCPGLVKKNRKKEEDTLGSCWSPLGKLKKSWNRRKKPTTMLIWGSRKVQKTFSVLISVALLDVLTSCK